MSLDSRHLLDTRCNRGHPLTSNVVRHKRRNEACRGCLQVAAGLQNTSVVGSLALKEWAVTIAALQSGDQTILLRKGGIRESGFRVQAPQFLLLPTAFHSEVQLLKPDAQERYKDVLHWDPKLEKELRLGLLAEVTGMWTTADPAALSALYDQHIWSQQYVENRLSWREKQPLTILELRCRHLLPPLVVPNTDSLWGCFSFAELEGAAVDDSWPSEPVVPDSAFQKRQQAARQHLESFGVRDVWCKPGAEN